MDEFVDFVEEKKIDGRKLMEVTEGIVKLWRPRANAKKFISFTQDLKNDPEKYLKKTKDNVITIKETNICVDSAYQTVSVRKISQDTSNFNRVEDILKKIVAPKSFLYRNQTKPERAVTSYLPMDAGTGKKPKKIFRLSSYEYPIFDLRSRFSKTKNCADRGYYSVKPTSKFYVQKSYKKIDARPKYKSLGAAEELHDQISDDHFYEDLCYYDVDKEKNKTNPAPTNPTQVKPCMVKIQELFQSFQSFKLPFFKKNEEVVEKVKKESVKEGPIYENNDSIVDMYDSIHVPKDETDSGNKEKHESEVTVEDYLEPVQVNKDYCDVGPKQKEESLLGFIMSYFETRFGRRETNDTTQSEDSDGEVCEREPTWEKHMADRPLPVPVESEPYYMNVDRNEAENLLRGQPDGTFVLRPSSQPSHAYTLSVSCANAVHNVGVRRRPDGRVALGFARRGERSFTSVTSLLRHHKKRRLLLVAGGDVIGATTLNETPHYYQTPSNIPITQIRQ
ncbi:uncharacterized protein [Epargyreus clarus]